jgi:hypothetical protein
MDSLTAYPCCPKGAPAANGPSQAAAMHQAINHDPHHRHHHHHPQQHHPLHHQAPAPNPVVFYLPNQQNNGGAHYGANPHQTPYGDHQSQQNHYNYHQTSVANYNPAPYQTQVQQQPGEQAKNKQPNYPSIYNNNSKLNLFQVSAFLIVGGGVKFT